jgi:hypothetical protein
MRLDAHVWSSFKEVEMRKHVLVLTTTALILTYGAIAASAQAPGVQTPGTQSPTIQLIPGSPTQQEQTPLQPRAQSGEEENNQDGHYDYPGIMGGMMGPGMMGHGTMGRGMMSPGHHGWHRSRDVAGPMMMRIIFSLMDADGDGKLTLQEFQAAHERIFKAMDTDHDGTVTLEEMQTFMRGR